MQWLIDLIIEAIGIPPVYIDRGDPADWDWELGDFVADGTWRDLDLSAIVPANAKGVIFFAAVRNAAIGKNFQLRKKGNVNERVVALARTQVGAQFVYEDLTTACDDDRIIQYNATAGVWQNLFLVVKAWWF